MYDPITETDRYNSARLVQLGYIILDDDGKELTNVFAEDADVINFATVEMTQQAGDSVTENLAGDDPGFGMQAGLGRDVLATTKTNFDPNLFHRTGEQVFGGDDFPLPRHADGETGQKGIKKTDGGLAKPFATATTKEARCIGPQIIPHRPDP